MSSSSRRNRNYVHVYKSVDELRNELNRLYQTEKDLINTISNDLTSYSEVQIHMRHLKSVRKQINGLNHLIHDNYQDEITKGGTTTPPLCSVFNK